MSDLPKWVQIVRDVGFPIAAAVVLAWIVIAKLPVLDRTATAIERHVADAHIQTALLRQICRNGAKTERQLEFCDYGLATWERSR